MIFAFAKIFQWAVILVLTLVAAYWLKKLLKNNKKK